VPETPQRHEDLLSDIQLSDNLDHIYTYIYIYIYISLIMNPRGGMKTSCLRAAGVMRCVLGPSERQDKWAKGMVLGAFSSMHQNGMDRLMHDGQALKGNPCQTHMTARVRKM
jgi:hypothetical protein